MTSAVQDLHKDFEVLQKVRNLPPEMSNFHQRLEPKDYLNEFWGHV